MKRLITLIALLYSSWLFCACLIQSSQLNCTMPMIINETCVIELDVPLVIEGMCEPIKAGPGFGASDTITFRQSGNIPPQIQLKSTVVPPTAIASAQVLNPGIWDLRSFTNTSQELIFENVLITLDAGTIILADAITLRLKGTSQMIPQPAV